MSELEKAHERDPKKRCWCKDIDPGDELGTRYMYYMTSDGVEHVFEKPVILEWLEGLGEPESMELDDSQSSSSPRSDRK